MRFPVDSKGLWPLVSAIRMGDEARRNDGAFMSNIVTIEIDLDSIITAKDRTETVRVPVSFPFRQ
jgi:hypothetical protein